MRVKGYVEIKRTPGRFRGWLIRLLGGFTEQAVYRINKGLEGPVQPVKLTAAVAVPPNDDKGLNRTAVELARNKAMDKLLGEIRGCEDYVVTSAALIGRDCVMEYATLLVVPIHGVSDGMLDGMETVMVREDTHE